MKKWLLLSIPLFYWSSCFPQTSYSITSFNQTPQDFKYLLLPNSEISKNDTTNEKILDLVEPMLLDSILHKRKQHHHVFLVGWLIHAFGGYNWRAVNMHKQKFVGTVVEEGRSGSFEYTEWDIKYHLNFHLQKYLFEDFSAYDLERKYHRQDIRPSHHTNYKVAPFVRDTNNIDASLYNIGCELTPPPAFIPQLNYLFFPTLPGAGETKAHPNFETEHPSMGFYGAFCLDCNHNCHPEMHPYEMVWWLKATDKDESVNKTWLLGIFHEGSNRFPKWSKNPMTGSVKIPFAFKYEEKLNDTLQINIDHLVFNKFEPDELKKIEVPQNSFNAKQLYQQVLFKVNDNTVINGNLRFNEIVKTDGLKYWFTDLNYDITNHVLSGYFNLATSVEDLYTTKITFASKDGD